MHIKTQNIFFCVTLASILFSGNLLSAEEKSAENKAPWQENTVEWLTKFTKPVSVENADATAEDEMKGYTDVITGTDITFDMVPIKGGSFIMGSSEQEQEKFAADPEILPEPFNNAAEGPKHEVKISPFWMGKCEVTWEEYEAFWMWLEKKSRETAKVEPTENDKIADAILRPTPAYSDMTFDMGREKRPAIGVSLYAAQMYCKWLSAKTGRYYRLPTEAEWEYACRAGTTTAFSFGDSLDDFEDYGWYYDNSDDKYQRVAQKKPNPWGLYDMHGNVREWCLDQFLVDGYKKQLDAADGKVLENPFSPFTKKGQRYMGVARGGSWTDDAQNCRSATRFPSSESWNQEDPQIPKSIWFDCSEKWLGFRIVRPLTTPTAEEAKIFEPDPEVAEEYIRLNPRQSVQ
ncbi:MAG: formylglycine-generating enzyme family protein [Planctomycetia bacterium]|nr:formylglycine-generating enzyme family protein [Planctomycetia bacterium]